MQPGSYLEIRLGLHAYALPVEFIQEIDTVGDITPLPNSSPFIRGLMNLRGQVVPVLDLKVRLGFAATPLTRQSCVVVIDGSGGATGLIVDGVVRVVNLQAGNILPPPAACHLKDRTLVVGIAQESGSMITLLDLANVMKEMGKPRPARGPLPRTEAVAPEGPAPGDPNLERLAVKLLS